MSTSGKRLSLSHPGVIVVVIVLMAAVTVLNVRTFGSKKPGRRPAQQVVAGAESAYPAVPIDLNQVLARSAAAGLQAPNEDWGDSPRAARDPFRKREAERTVTVAPAVADETAQAARDTLVCSAVMLGGRRPLALIDGRALAVGDRVHDCRLVRITTEGAWLRNARGDEVFLRVGEQRNSKKAYRMVTDVPDRRDLGDTALEGNVE